MKRILITTVSMLFILNLSAQQTAKGLVYSDANSNRVKDKNEKGIADVPVSNGRDVVLTDVNGYYELPVEEDNIIFVIKPQGYNLPVDENNLPQFYYIHKPNGSPSDFKYKGSSPTGELPKSIDFGLLKAEESDKYSALIFGDPQPYNEQEVDYFDRAIVSELLDNKKVKFGISLGDIVGNDLDLHLPYIKSVKKIGVPWFNVMGNHDMNFDAKKDILSNETFEKNFGPTNFSFNYGKVHYIILDDILYPDPRTGKGYWAGFRKDQLEFISNDLKFVDKNNLIVLAMHIQIYDVDGQFRENDKQELFRMLKDFPNVLLLTAHMHTQMQYFHSFVDGWLQDKPLHEYNMGTTSGDWYSGDINGKGLPKAIMRDGTPQGYAFLNIDGTKYTIDYKVAGESEDRQITIFNPKVIPHNKRTSSKIFANFYTGIKSNIVECRIDDQEWQSMEWTNDVDPAYMNYVYRWDISDTLIEGKRPSNAVKSTHLWSINFPRKLSKGTHKIEVKATDVFGRTFVETSNFRVE